MKRFSLRVFAVLHLVLILFAVSAGAAPVGDKDCPPCELLRQKAMADFIAATNASIPPNNVRLAAAAPDKGPAVEAAKPSILFCSPSDLGAGFVDLDYLKDLKAQGFEVDYTKNLDELTWERIRPFNALVIYVAPNTGYLGHTPAMTPATFNALLEKFLQAGGGVFLMPVEYNIKSEILTVDFQEKLGFRIPAERIREKESKNLSTLTRIESSTPTLAYTDQISPSPVSQNVSGIWYPFGDHYMAQATNPLFLGKEWTAVVKATPTSTTEKVDFAKAPLPLANPFYFPGGSVTSPAIFAIREYGKGRVALMSTWPQYSVGSGTKWLFDREVLSKGVAGRKSDFAQLLANTFHWLAQPSLKESTLGGATTVAERLEPPNYRPDVLNLYAERPHTKSWEEIGADKPDPNLKTFRGLIGAKSTHGGGTSTVEQYAATAKKLGLDFVIIVDDFDKLTPQKLEALKADCAKYSDDTVKLWGGYTIKNNIGNSLFCFGPTVFWPPANVLTGPNNTVLMQQHPGAEVPSLDWLLSMMNENNVGHYDIKAAEAVGGMRMSDLKIYSMAALHTYRDGKLVEDVTDEYFTTAQGTIPPGPVSFNEVRSVSEMEREVTQRHFLTYARTHGIEKLFSQALSWTFQYSGPNLFTSDGPIVQAWPECFRVVPWGGDEFVTGHIVMPSLAVVSSDVGLKEIRIYNGRDLYRRFLPGGAKEWSQLLILEGAVQKNLVLVAEDTKGGQAVTFARRSWKDGSGTAAIFCADHVNDCKSPADGPVLLAHGPYEVAVTSVPQMPDPGETWDGGPAAARSLAGFGSSTPTLTSDLGTEVGGRFNQTPLLEFSDEMGAALTSVRDRVFDPKLIYLNPWYGFGPSTPTKLMEHTAKFRLWSIPTIGPRGSGWAGPGMRVGVQPSMHRGRIKFKQNQTIQNLVLLSSYSIVSPSTQVHVVLGLGKDAPKTVLLNGQTTKETARIATGDWFGIYSPQIGNSALFINRGAPFILNYGDPNNASGWHNTTWFNLSADMEGKAVKTGEEYSYEMFSMTYPLDSSAKAADELVAMKKYIDNPTGLKIIQGKRLSTPGIIDLEGRNYVAEISIPKPAGRPKMTLPARVTGLNRRWSAGYWLKKGYEQGFYGNGINRYTPLGMDSDGNAYVPIHVTWADETHIEAGHPVIAGAEGKDLFIQVTHVNEDPQRWHVSVNNPTDKTISTTLTRIMDLPGLTFLRKSVVLKPGEYLVLQ